MDASLRFASRSIIDSGAARPAVTEPEDPSSTNVDKLVCVTALADDLKAKHQEMKRTRHAGRTEEAAAALGDVVAAADTLRKVRHVR